MSLQFTVFQPANRFDLLAPSRYRAIVSEDLCTGCQECVDRCVFDAIEMKKTQGSKKLKASIINEKCMGCGVCIVGCKQKALTYEMARPPEYIRRPSQGAKPPGNLWGYYDLK